MIEDLKKSAEKIRMTDETKKQMIRNIELKTSGKEEFNMKKIRFKKILPIAAVIVILAVSVGAVVANHFRGFKDVVKDGAVIDTVFEEATENIQLFAEVGNNLVVTANILDYQNIPYSELDAIDNIHYLIQNASGEIIDKGRADAMSEFVDGKVAFNVFLENIPDGEYILAVDELVGSKKADRPLSIRGVWECAFAK